MVWHLRYVDYIVNIALLKRKYLLIIIIIKIVTEISPLEKRGQTTSTVGILLTLGLLISFVWGLAIDIENSDKWYPWRLIFMFPIITNIIQLILIRFLLVESPRYFLIDMNSEDEVFKNFN